MGKTLFMAKKLNSLDALAQIQFDNLAPDPVPIPESEPQFEAQHLEAHFQQQRAGWKNGHPHQRV